MQPLTQSSLQPSNALQTAVACLLEISPSAMPDETLFDRVLVDEDGSWIRLPGRSYFSVLNAFLRKHHGLGLLIDSAASKRVSTGFHLLIGRAKGRPPEHRKHTVVAKDGAMVWDPHPEGQGLIEEGQRAAFLIPWPIDWDVLRAADLPSACLCLACDSSREADTLTEGKAPGEAARVSEALGPPRRPGMPVPHRSFHELYQMTRAELSARPTLAQSQTHNLKFDDGKHRVWLSRMKREDYESAEAELAERISFERFEDGRWIALDRYGRAL